MGLVGFLGVDLPYQGHLSEHIAFSYAFVGSPFHEGDGEHPGGGAEQHHGGLAEAFVDLSGQFGVLAAGIGLSFESTVANTKLRLMPMSKSRPSKWLLGREVNFSIGHLKENPDGGIAREEFLFGYVVPVLGRELCYEIAGPSRLIRGCPVALVAQDG